MGVIVLYLLWQVGKLKNKQTEPESPTLTSRQLVDWINQQLAMQKRMIEVLGRMDRIQTFTAVDKQSFRIKADKIKNSLSNIEETLVIIKDELKK